MTSGLSQSEKPRSLDDLVIHHANTPIHSFPRAEGSAAWEKANLHKLLSLATVLRDTRAQLVYYHTADSDIAGYAPALSLQIAPLIPGGIASHPEWNARGREDAYYGAFYEAVVRQGANVAMVGGDAQSFREAPALTHCLPNTRFFCNNHGLGPHPDAVYPYERCNGIVHYVAISAAQVREYPTLQHMGVVYNSLHPDEFHFQEQPVNATILQEGETVELAAGYALFVGRMNREKGAHLAIAIAKRAGMPLVMAGPLARREWEPDYYEREVFPHLDGRQVRYLGERGPAELDRLYRGAAVKLFPITWNEPFGFVVAEALARGTPVLATPLGAAPELIQDGYNGFLAHTVEKAVACLKELPSIKRRNCYESALQRFTWEATGRAYLDLIWKSFWGESYFPSTTSR